MNRIQLSPDSWIEGDWLYTTNPVVWQQWRQSAPNKYEGALYEGNDIDGWTAGGWRIPLSALPEVYGYREGEPWCIVEPIGNYIVCRYEPELGRQSWRMVLHLNAVILCAGGADSLRTLHRVITEVLAGKEER